MPLYMVKEPSITYQYKQAIKKLSSNDKKTRDLVLESLPSLLSLRPLEYLELLKLWKGLYYCMWMCDRPLAQQKLANDIGDLILKCPSDSSLLFLKAFWETICREWNSIDSLRLDKFYLLIRKNIEGGFRLCMSSNWSEEIVNKYVLLLQDIPLNPTNPKIPNSIRYHILDVYLDELDKVFPVKNKNQNFQIKVFLSPFLNLIEKSHDKYVKKRVSEAIFLDKRIELWNNKDDNYNFDDEVLDIDDKNEEDFIEEWYGFDDQ
ncbi:hypothetical protein T552_02809 [Pneumocystis carinii B80]|uniref:Ribosomal RNA-processing protein 1 n=1 Tax=Pneumocystis carinii (strain B80) TaxID=1408658 RepID=A0A0W4ZD92_PNEC8|nr:hypothetical protein T552_02809 [Pneumocystis carinii B80]KTW26323.1 hypothetical protein T552_02809 [Pneumocystis carinii B80]